MTNPRCSAFLRPAIVIGLVACVPLAACIARLVSTSHVSPVDADYLYRPLGWSPAARTVVGVVSLVLVLGAAALVLRCRSTSRLALPGVLAPLASASAFLGLTYHVVTAPVIGANIGGGLMLFAVAPFLVAMIIIAVTQARSAR